MKAAVLAATGLALVLAGCSSSYDNDYPMGLPNDTLTCPDDPPDVCTMDYRPVFGYDQQGGILGEFSNACGACARKRTTRICRARCPRRRQHLRMNRLPPRRPVIDLP